MTNMKDIFSLYPTKGEIGLEVEMEGKNLPSMDYNNKKLWNKFKDHSLRGESGEWVLNKPIDRDCVFHALAELNGMFKSCESTLHPSDRCGVHVHLNVQQWTKETLLKFATLWYIVEDIMVHYCGQDREGNLFCLRARDAEYILELLEKAARGTSIIGGMGALTDCSYRYSALNFNALVKFGSLEFRCLPTPKKIMDILIWVEMLLKLKDAVDMFDTRPDIIRAFRTGRENISFHSIFGSSFTELLWTEQSAFMIRQASRRCLTLAHEKPRVRKREVNKVKV